MKNNNTESKLDSVLGLLDKMEATHKKTIVYSETDFAKLAVLMEKLAVKLDGNIKHPTFTLVNDNTVETMVTGATISEIIKILEAEDSHVSYLSGDYVSIDNEKYSLDCILKADEVLSVPNTVYSFSWDTGDFFINLTSLYTLNGINKTVEEIMNELGVLLDLPFSKAVLESRIAFLSKNHTPNAILSLTKDNNNVVLGVTSAEKPKDYVYYVDTAQPYNKVMDLLK